MFKLPALFLCWPIGSNLNFTKIYIIYVIYLYWVAAREGGVNVPLTPLSTAINIKERTEEKKMKKKKERKH